MNVVDILIVVALLISLLGGFRRGFWLTLAQYAGAAGGLLLGARFAPDIVDWFGVVDSTGRQFTTLLVLVVASAVGGSIGFALVGPLRRWLLEHRLLGFADSLLGAALSAAVTLAIVWLLALTFARGPVPELARAIQQSTIARQLDRHAPVPPAFVARVQQILSGTFLPPVFAGLEPDLPSSDAPSPESVDTAEVRAAAMSTVRVEGLGCGGIATGSGFAVGDGLIVTNAHVVSGTGRTRVTTPAGRSGGAVVAVLDAEQDLAILRVGDLDLPALAPGEGGAGAEGAVIGYPGGGPLRISPAVVERRLTTRGRDIFNRRLVTREILVVTAEVRSGNSGGPLVDETGRFLGAVFASSVSSPGQAYVIPADDVIAAVRAAESGQPPVDARSLPCVR